MAERKYDKPRGKVKIAGSNTIKFQYAVAVDPKDNVPLLWWRTPRRKVWGLLTSVRANITKREAEKMVRDHLLRQL